MATTARPRRSVLYMPGSNPRALDKAKTLAADGLIFDLEDAVAPDAKEEARRLVVEAALGRAESRGAHYRSDFPHADPNPCHSSLTLASLTAALAGSATVAAGEPLCRTR